MTTDARLSHLRGSREPIIAVPSMTTPSTLPTTTDNDTVTYDPTPEPPAEAERPVDMPAPRHRSWCSGTCDWTRDYHYATTWSCDHTAWTASLKISGFGDVPRGVDAQVSMVETYDERTREHVWSEDGPHAFVTELDAGPTSPEDLYKVAGMFIVLAERLTQVLAAETTR